MITYISILSIFMFKLSLNLNKFKTNFVILLMTPSMYWYAVNQMSGTNLQKACWLTYMIIKLKGGESKNQTIFYRDFIISILFISTNSLVELVLIMLLQFLSILIDNEKLYMLYKRISRSLISIMVFTLIILGMTFLYKTEQVPFSVFITLISIWISSIILRLPDRSLRESTFFIEIYNNSFFIFIFLYKIIDFLINTLGNRIVEFLFPFMISILVFSTRNMWVNHRRIEGEWGGARDALLVTITSFYLSEILMPNQYNITLFYLLMLMVLYLTYRLVSLTKLKRHRIKISTLMLCLPISPILLYKLKLLSNLSDGRIKFCLAMLAVYPFIYILSIRNDRKAV